MQRDSLGEMPQGEEAPDPGRKPALNFPLHLLLGMKQTPLGPECPLQPRPCVPAGRFVSGLTQPSPHCVFRTVIPGRVFSSQAVHLQIQCVLSVVSGDGESALHRVCVDVLLPSYRINEIHSSPSPGAWWTQLIP